jgi:hypothetical protein
MFNSLKLMASMRQRYLRKLTKSDSSSHLTKVGNKIRRFILCLIGKDYVKEQEKLRFGDCVLCGKCCQLVIPCPFLEGKEEVEADHLSCLIYHKGRPPQCVAFPIDERDLADVNFQCGYYFLDSKGIDNLSLTTPS